MPDNINRQQTKPDTTRQDQERSQQQQQRPSDSGNPGAAQQHPARGGQPSNQRDSTDPSQSNMGNRPDEDRDDEQRGSSARGRQESSDE